METSRTKALKALATSMPIANQQIANGMQQANLMGLQRSVAAAPAPTSLREVQAAGAQVAAQAGAPAVEAAKQTVQQVGQLGQTGLAESARGNAEDIGSRKQALANVERTNDAELAGMGRDFKQQIVDARMQFGVDETGRKTMNEFQLADWAALKAKSSEEHAAKMQEMKQASERNLQFLDAAQRKIEQEMEFLSRQRITESTYAMRAKLAQAKHDIEAKIAREKARAANRQAAWTTGGTIVGGVIGAVVGGPVGAAVGASAGGAVGSGIGSQVNG